MSRAYNFHPFSFPLNVQNVTLPSVALVDPFVQLSDVFLGQWNVDFNCEIYIPLAFRLLGDELSRRTGETFDTRVFNFQLANNLSTMHFFRLESNFFSRLNTFKLTAMIVRNFNNDYGISVGLRDEIESLIFDRLLKSLPGPGRPLNIEERKPTDSMVNVPVPAPTLSEGAYVYLTESELNSMSDPADFLSVDIRYNDYQNTLFIGQWPEFYRPEWIPYVMRWYLSFLTSQPALLNEPIRNVVRRVFRAYTPENRSNSPSLAFFVELIDHRFFNVLASFVSQYLIGTCSLIEANEKAFCIGTSESIRAFYRNAFPASNSMSLTHPIVIESCRENKTKFSSQSGFKCDERSLSNSNNKQNFWRNSTKRIDRRMGTAIQHSVSVPPPYSAFKNPFNN